MSNQKQNSNIKNTVISLKLSLLITAFLSLFLLVVLLLQNISPWWHNFSAHPRDFSNTLGLLFSWALHGSFSHLFANLFALWILIPLTLTFHAKDTFKSIPVIWLVSYLFIWLFGSPNSQHIGISGIVYGLISFTIFLGFLERRFSKIFTTIVVLVLFASTIKSLVPSEGISFSAHLGGFIGGILAAFIFGKKNKNKI